MRSRRPLARAHRAARLPDADRRRRRGWIRRGGRGVRSGPPSSQRSARHSPAPALRAPSEARGQKGTEVGRGDRGDRRFAHTARRRSPAGLAEILRSESLRGRRCAGMPRSSSEPVGVARGGATSLALPAAVAGRHGRCAALPLGRARTAAAPRAGSPCTCGWPRVAHSSSCSGHARTVGRRRGTGSNGCASR